MNSRNWIVSTKLLALLCCLTLGCGETVSDRPELGQVTGQVTFDGKPLADADVLFQPQHGRASTSKTDNDGFYKMDYLNDITGAVVGHNRVLITTGREADESNPGDGRPELLPGRYHAQTILSADVQPGSNQIDFHLTSESKVN
ncbi:hypothetical protein V22_23810 [Calycomorphotria hydatis]|uniref:Nickel uptake substrate-specific transmembrane region n=2 Tax=Calycomorphotria hydatis TaxID=2528027 RepID=A0A517T9T1_9PLAN|nr:hypothetical protein V22_23810 [Calycomorphotria hydatis]